MRLFVVNSFSITMVEEKYLERGVNVYVVECDNPKELLDYFTNPVISALGHEDIARIVSEELGHVLPVNRQKIKINKRDEVLVAQYIGPRLPEGTKTLPEGAKIKYYLVHLI